MYFWILLEMKSAIKGEQAWKDDRNNVNVRPLRLALQRTTKKKRVEIFAHPWCYNAKSAQGSKGREEFRKAQQPSSILPPNSGKIHHEKVCVYIYFQKSTVDFRRSVNISQ